MLVQFYCAPSFATRAFAYVGTLVLASHSVYSVLLSRRLVDWQGRFYDHIGDASAVLSAARAIGVFVTLDAPNATANATANTTSAVDVAINTGAAEVSALLSEFVWIVMPLALVHPINRYIRRRFTFTWRMCLVRVYTERWTHMQCIKLEGISQRIQEDTQRFGRGLETCVSDILDALLTLVVFAPTLIDLGRTIPAVGHAAWLAPFGAAWLFVGALLLALAGLFVSLVVAQRLVGLEVQNQVVEAEFRKGLVLVEVGGVVHAEDPNPPTQSFEPPTASSTQFATSFVDLRTNYLALFRHFFAFDLWISSFNQATVIIPYVVVAPLLFRHHDPITLGTLVKTASVFGHVFSALSLPAFNWATVNDFRSVIRRLAAMEQAVGLRRGNRPVAPPLQPPRRQKRTRRKPARTSPICGSQRAHWSSSVVELTSSTVLYDGETVVATPLQETGDGCGYNDGHNDDASASIELKEQTGLRI